MPAPVAIYDRYLRDRGNVPNMFRTMVHRPEVELMAAIGLFNYFNRINDLLETEPTQPVSAEELATAALKLELLSSSSLVLSSSLYG